MDDGAGRQEGNKQPPGERVSGDADGKKDAMRTTSKSLRASGNEEQPNIQEASMKKGATSSRKK